MSDDGGARVVVAVVADDTPYCATGPELLADRLFSLGASAVSELPEDQGGVGHGAGGGADVGAGGGVRLVADLPASALDRLDVPFELLEHDPTWEDAWRDHAVAVPVGQRLLLRPEWVDADVRGAAADDLSSPDALDSADRLDSADALNSADCLDSAPRIEVVLDAAHAFGSGSHPTTRLCLEAIEGLGADLVGARVLDVGSGTGVLGVAALVLGAGSLVALDVDAAAIAATRRTAELNGVTDRVIEVSSRSVSEVTAEHGPFDLALANLLVPIIESIGADLAAAVAPGGHLVLSGLLADPSTRQVQRAIDVTGLRPADIGVAELDGWVSLVNR